MNATARVTILMTPKEKRELFAQAKLAGFDSVGAYLRRKALGPEDSTLDRLVELVSESTRRANAAIDRVLASMKRHEKEAPRHEAIARAQAEAEIRSWSPERLAAFQENFGLTEGRRP